MKISTLIAAILLTACLLLPAVPTSFASTITYTYDPAGRLVGANYGPGKSITYTYDPNGNLIKRLSASAYSLADVIAVLRINAGLEPADPVYASGDINGDGHIGLEEVGYMMQQIAGKRD